MPARRASSSRSHTGSANGSTLRRQRQQPRQHVCLGKCRRTKPLQQGVVMQQQLVQLVRQRLAAPPGRRPGSRGAPPCPHRPGRCRARWCRSCGRPAPPPAPGPAPDASAGSAWRSRRCAAMSGVTSMPCALTFSISASSASGSTTTPLPMMPSLPRTRPGGQQRQLVGLVADHQRVAGVMAALEAHDDIGAAGQPVHHLSLALVAPLGADHRDIGHAVPSGPVVSGQRAACRCAGCASTAGGAPPPRDRPPASSAAIVA